jgi:hypothetical protein
MENGSFYHAVRDEKYRKESGEYYKERAEREQEERNKDDRLRRELGGDHPNEYK